MKKAILKRGVNGKNYSLSKGQEVFVAQTGADFCLVRIKENDTFEFPVSKSALKFVSDEIKLEIHTKKQPRKSNSMFYHDKHIATLTKGKRTVYVETSGEMAAAFTIDGNLFKGEMLAKELRSRKTTDRGLSTMISNDLVQMNNWFRITEENKKNDVLKEDIAHTYDEAIEKAKSILNTK